MITKLLIFILTFFLAILNITLSLLPLDLLLIPIGMLHPEIADKISMGAAVWSLFLVTSYIVFYLIFDWIFSLTVRRYVKKNVPISKAKAVNGYQDIADSFDWLVKKFGISGVQLYVDGDIKTVNAYAISGMRRKAVVITLGLINKMYDHADGDSKLALEGIRGILGHELSHIANRDSLPAILTIANESAIRLIDKFIYSIFKIISSVFRIIPYIGSTISYAFMSIYKLLHFFMMKSYQLLFMPLYRLLQKAMSRSVEFRCDREAAYAFGGSRIAAGLDVLGPGAYFSLFSTHPRTKTRIKKVQHINVRPGVISPSIFSQLINIISLLLILYFWYMLLLVVANQYFPALYDILKHYNISSL
jgi:Zn-dependent protease with chaperone function